MVNDRLAAIAVVRMREAETPEVTQDGGYQRALCQHAAAATAQSAGRDAGSGPVRSRRGTRPLARRQD